MSTTQALHRKIVRTGKPIAEAQKAMILVHGRGADAQDIMSLASYFPVKDFALLAPEATGNTWYPYSFMSPVTSNEPWLTSALHLLAQIVNEIEAGGIEKHNIYFLGFSQGACLTLEFIARNAARYGGVIAFTGGLIGEKIDTANYKGDFEGMPVFIGTSDPDPHVPVTRVQETTRQLTSMHAQVTEKVYPMMGHTITQEEIREANQIVFGLEL
jgi:phospholipase/carboxylesterase